MIKTEKQRNINLLYLHRMRVGFRLKHGGGNECVCGSAMLGKNKMKQWTHPTPLLLSEMDDDGVKTNTYGKKG